MTKNISAAHLNRDGEPFIKKLAFGLIIQCGEKHLTKFAPYLHEVCTA
jgi:hypothetical protein